MSKSRPSKEFRNFTAAVDKLFSVPREVLQKRIEQHRERAAQNPRKRGAEAEG